MNNLQEITENLDKIVAAYYYRTDILAKLAQFFEQSLQENARALNYLTSVRGLSHEILKKYRVGYCPSTDLVLKFAQDNNIGIADLVSTGELHLLEDGTYRMRQSGRVVFPYTDFEGRITAFFARSLEEHPQIKYINSRNSLTFFKGATFYGLSQALDAIKQECCAILVEGSIDALSMANAAFANVLAVGTAGLTEYQVLLLKLLTNKVITIFDNDAAGRKATTVTANLCRSYALEHISIDISPLAVKDIDEALRKFGAQPIAQIYATLR